MKLTAGFAAVVALVAAGCGGAAPPAHPAATGNTRVCEHYRAQRAIVLNAATPNLGDAVKIVGWVAADQAQAAPGTPLARDLGKMLIAMQGHGGSTYTASRAVAADCAALGVKFTR
jgi:hypothetical protein